MKFQKKVFIVKEKMIFILYTNPYMVYWFIDALMNLCEKYSLSGREKEERQTVTLT